jgi:hypothetical protein
VRVQIQKKERGRPKEPMKTSLSRCEGFISPVQVLTKNTREGQ